MNFKQAIQVLKDKQNLNITDEQDALYHEASVAILKAAKLDADALDWIREGDYEGTETPRSIRREYREA